jgi:hypothetical protein
VKITCDHCLPCQCECVKVADLNMRVKLMCECELLAYVHTVINCDSRDAISHVNDLKLVNGSRVHFSCDGMGYFILYYWLF